MARVLLVGHTGLVSGAELATLELAADLPTGLEPIIACPPGGFSESARGLGLTVRALRGTAGSLKLHPVHTPRAVAELAAMGVGLRLLARRERVALIHAVSLRAGIAAALACRLGGPPFVLSQHDVFPRSRIGPILRTMIDPPAAAVIANSDYTLRSLVQAGFATAINVVTPAVDPDRFSRTRFDRDSARHRLGAAPNDLLLGLVGQITPWKGQDLAVEALGLLRERHPAARLIIAGETRFASGATRYDNEAYLARLRQKVADLGLSRAVQFVGQQEDVPALMRALDVLLVPSWEEPFGRVVIEGMAMALPVLATSRGGPAEIITHGVNGLLADPHDAESWASEIGVLLDSPQSRNELGEAGRRRAVDYSSPQRAAQTAEIYRDVLRSNR